MLVLYLEMVMACDGGRYWEVAATHLAFTQAGSICSQVSWEGAVQVEQSLLATLASFD